MLLQKLILSSLMILSIYLGGCQSFSQSVGLSDREWAYTPALQKMAMLNNHINNKGNWCQKQTFVNHAQAPIFIELESGYASLWPGKVNKPIEPLRLLLKPGDCVNVALQSKDHQHQSQLDLFYDGRSLILDPLFYDYASSNGTLQIDKHPLWLNGFSYSNLSTTGYASLNKLKLTIHEQRT